MRDRDGGRLNPSGEEPELLDMGITLESYGFWSRFICWTHQEKSSCKIVRVGSGGWASNNGRAGISATINGDKFWLSLGLSIGN